MEQSIFQNCTLCPRNCGVDRTKAEKGCCGETDELVVARAALHLWEEPCISGEAGSGTVFFRGCALGCIYCQNHTISRGTAGKQISVKRLSEIFLELQEQGANNINLVTPSHFVPLIIEAIDRAKNMKLTIPMVYNSSGYEKVETLKLLEGYINIYLPDLKYKSAVLSKKYSGAQNYFTCASAAIQEMVRQVGKPDFQENGILKKGVLVRHLMLPGCIEDSKNILAYLFTAFGHTIYLSIMNQYTPVAPLENYPELNRKINDLDYQELIDYAISLGVENAFIQEGETASESFIPMFDGQGV